MREAGGLYWYSRDLRMGVKLANPGSVGVSVFTRELQFPSVREDDCTRVLCQSWQGYSWVLLTAVPCLWHLCSQPCKHRVCVCVCVSVCVSVCPCVCTCVPEICAKPQYQVSLERWKLQSPPSARDGETSRSPGAPAWDPEDKEEECPGPGVHPRQQPCNILQCSHSSIRNAGATIVCMVLIWPGLYLCFKILSLITWPHLLFHLQCIGQMMSCCISFLCSS